MQQCSDAIYIGVVCVCVPRFLVSIIIPCCLVSMCASDMQLPENTPITKWA